MDFMCRVIGENVVKSVKRPLLLRLEHTRSWREPPSRPKFLYRSAPRSKSFRLCNVPYFATHCRSEDRFRPRQHHRSGAFFLCAIIRRCKNFIRSRILFVDVYTYAYIIRRVKAVHEEANADLDPSSFTKPQEAKGGRHVNRSAMRATRPEELEHWT